MSDAIIRFKRLSSVTISNFEVRLDVIFEQEVQKEVCTHITLINREFYRLLMRKILTVDYINSLVDALDYDISTLIDYNFYDDEFTTCYLTYMLELIGDMLLYCREEEEYEMCSNLKRFYKRFVDKYGKKLVSI